MDNCVLFLFPCEKALQPSDLLGGEQSSWWVTDVRCQSPRQETENALWAASPSTLSSGNSCGESIDELPVILAVPVRSVLLAFSVCFRNSLNGWKSLQYNVSDSCNVSPLFLNRERPTCNFCAGEHQSGVLPSIVPLWIQKSRWNHNPAGWCSHGKKDGSQMAKVANLASVLFFTLCCTIRKSPGVTSRGAGLRIQRCRVEVFEAATQSSFLFIRMEVLFQKCV